MPEAETIESFAPTETVTPVAPTLTPEQEAQKVKDDAEQKRVELLRDTVAKIVDDLFANYDFTVYELGFATDLFKDLMLIKSHSSTQFDELIKDSDVLNEKYNSVLGKDLTKMVYEEPVKEVASTSDVVGV